MYLLNELDINTIVHSVFKNRQVCEVCFLAGMSGKRVYNSCLPVLEDAVYISVDGFSIVHMHVKLHSVVQLLQRERQAPSHHQLTSISSEHALRHTLSHRCHSDRLAHRLSHTHSTYAAAALSLCGSTSKVYSRNSLLFLKRSGNTIMPSLWARCTSCMGCAMCCWAFSNALSGLIAAA